MMIALLLLFCLQSPFLQAGPLSSRFELHILKVRFHSPKVPCQLNVSSPLLGSLGSL
jgi:hypothetical protein